MGFISFLLMMGILLVQFWTFASGDTKPLEVVTTPDGAEVWISDKMIGVTPLKTREGVAVGADVVLRKKGYNTDNIEISSAELTKMKINVDLVKMDSFIKLSNQEIQLTPIDQKKVESSVKFFCRLVNKKSEELVQVKNFNAMIMTINGEIEYFRYNGDKNYFYNSKYVVEDLCMSPAVKCEIKVRTLDKIKYISLQKECWE